MRILYVTTIGGTMSFFTSYIQTLLDEGHQVDIATNENSGKVPECYREWGCKVYQIDTSRSPLNRGNLKAIRQIKSLAAAQKYDIVHCHTPIAAMCTRLACRKMRKNGTKVIYTAHGFHFYKGAPLKNWMIYYPVEKFCAHFTDVLITINREDYALAQKKLKARRVEYVSGVGIDIQEFAEKTINKEEKKQKIGVPKDGFLLLSVGELNKNKNHGIVIRALAQMQEHSIHYAIAGIGNEKDDILELTKKLGIEKQVHLLGFRSDVAELYHAADIYVHPSLREGLPVSVMEAMTSGLPCAVSKIRGNVDLIDEKGGAFFNPNSVEACVASFESLLNSDLGFMGRYNAKKIRSFSKEAVKAQMMKIYFSESIYGKRNVQGEVDG